ncbi:hypothetical protein G3R49_12845 [Shewanella sp. WXL01]|uniref:hypothetical protein n=1 Tax=Shewanella sp. WXL01 TaxID=2709721 RepID=UPI0014385E29|nr:hypothetical protein [Shewanella sp. WXL01]NKF51445.1 hypothetical protein [Shewanella sp. WXL01]
MQYHIFNPSEPVMVTFPPVCQAIAKDANLDDAFVWGFDYFAKKHMNVIAFNHIGEGNYFDSPKLLAFIDDLAPQLKQFPASIGYGASLGGFALGLLADRLQLSKALLLMPQSTYCKQTAPWDPIVVNSVPSSRSDMATLDAKNCKTPLTIIYDPLSLQDKNHMDRFEQTLTKFKVYAVGHRIPRALQHLGILNDVILQFRQGDIDEDAFYQGIRGRRYLTYYYRDAYKKPTSSYTSKRLLVIYRHKATYRLKTVKFEPAKIADRLKSSVQKRINKIRKIFNNDN